MIDHGRRQLYGSVAEVRKQYALPAVIVEGEGDWSKLTSVEHVENIENGREGTLLYLRPGVTPDQVLAAIAADPDLRIQRFELAVPSLNDIFIQVVSGARHE
jgi:ABC-2 type transport system ATP-binding protein